MLGKDGKYISVANCPIMAKPTAIMINVLRFGDLEVFKG